MPTLFSEFLIGHDEVFGILNDILIASLLLGGDFELGRLPGTPITLVLRLFHSWEQFAMVGDASCGWGQAKYGAPASWEMTENVQINENF